MSASRTRAPVFALGALSLLFLIGCSRSSEPASTADGTPAAPARRFLTVGTAPQGGAFFVVGGVIADVVKAHTADLNWQVSAEATKGTQENIRRLDAGEIEFALANAAITHFAVRGEGKWEKPYGVRVVMTLAPNVALFITPQSSGIKTMADLKGKRVVCGPAGAGFEYFLEPILAAHGVQYADFTPLHNTQSGAVDMLADGSAAAAFLGGAVPTASILQACTAQDMHFIPYEAGPMASLFERYAFFWGATIKPGVYKGQDAAYQGMNVGSMILVTSAAIDEETVYRFTKAAYENRADVVKGHPAGKAINPKNVVRKVGTPFHPGAIRFYKEIGIWPADGDS